MHLEFARDRVELGALRRHAQARPREVAARARRELLLERMKASYGRHKPLLLPSGACGMSPRSRHSPLRQSTYVPKIRTHARGLLQNDSSTEARVSTRRQVDSNKDSRRLPQRHFVRRNVRDVPTMDDGTAPWELVMKLWNGEFDSSNGALKVGLRDFGAVPPLAEQIVKLCS